MIAGTWMFKKLYQIKFEF